MLLEEKPFGFVFQFGSFLGCFGNRHASLEDMKKQFPKLQFVGVKQTHSDLALHHRNQSSDSIEADAIFGNTPNIAYYIKTADCGPILLIDGKTNYVSAIHAGWKGVALRIVPKTIEALLHETKSTASHLFAVVGPHIQQPSFEVDEPVKNQIFQSVASCPAEAARKRGDKFDVDLNLILKIQIAEMGLPADHVNSLMIDTKINKDFHSYRRDREKSGRNISFVARLT